MTSSLSKPLPPFPPFSLARPFHLFHLVFRIFETLLSSLPLDSPENSLEDSSQNSLEVVPSSPNSSSLCFGLQSLSLILSLKISSPCLRPWLLSHTATANSSLLGFSERGSFLLLLFCVASVVATSIFLRLEECALQNF